MVLTARRAIPRSYGGSASFRTPPRWQLTQRKPVSRSARTNNINNIPSACEKVIFFAINSKFNRNLERTRASALSPSDIGRRWCEFSKRAGHAAFERKVAQQHGCAQGRCALKAKQCKSRASTMARDGAERPTGSLLRTASGRVLLSFSVVQRARPACIVCATFSAMTGCQAARTCRSQRPAKKPNSAALAC